MSRTERETRETALRENRERIARLCREIIEDIDTGVPEPKLVVTLEFLETLMRQRRSIKANRDYHVD